MQDAGGVANTTGIHGHVDDLLLHLRRLADIGIIQQKRAPTAESTLPAAVALLAFRRHAMPDNIGPVAIGAVQHLGVTACNRNGPGLHSARFLAHITCLYPSPPAHITCL